MSRPQLFSRPNNCPTQLPLGLPDPPPLGVKVPKKPVRDPAPDPHEQAIDETCIGEGQVSPQPLEDPPA